MLPHAFTCACGHACLQMHEVVVAFRHVALCVYGCMKSCRYMKSGREACLSKCTARSFQPLQRVLLQTRLLQSRSAMVMMTMERAWNLCPAAVPVEEAAAARGRVPVRAAPRVTVDGGQWQCGSAACSGSGQCGLQWLLRCNQHTTLHWAGAVRSAACSGSGLASCRVACSCSGWEGRR